MALYRHFETQGELDAEYDVGRSVPDFKAIAAFLKAAGSWLQAGSPSRDHSLCLRAIRASRSQTARLTSDSGLLAECLGWGKSQRMASGIPRLRSSLIMWKRFAGNPGAPPP